MRFTKLVKASLRVTQTNKALTNAQLNDKYHFINNGFYLQVNIISRTTPLLSCFLSVTS